MLRHPFFGVVGPLEQSNSIASEQTDLHGLRQCGRRTFFGQALAAAAGGAALLLGRSSAGQELSGAIVPSDRDTIRAGSGSAHSSTTTPSVAVPQSSGTVTTQAVGEEGGTVTTQALGEEGGWDGRRRWREPTYTTQALGEEGGWYPPPRRPWYPSYPPPTSPPPGTVTTYALGEEGSYWPPPVHRPPVNPPPTYTTFALGEEGGGYYRRY